jgi:hypothetical protein
VLLRVHEVELADPQVERDAARQVRERHHGLWSFPERRRDRQCPRLETGAATVSRAATPPPTTSTPVAMR